MNNLFSIDLMLLFFILGLAAGFIKSDLKVPEQISQIISIYLLLAIGLKGGHEIRSAEHLNGLGAILIIGLISCLFIPYYLFRRLKNMIGSANAAALAACYGSVSAITFIAAQNYLDHQNLPTSGFMVAVMALMETPAIIFSLWLLRVKENQGHNSNQSVDLFAILKTKSVVLLIGGFIIGLCLNASTWISIKPIVQDSFRGILIFFLLDLGLVAYNQLKYLKENKKIYVIVGSVLPLLHGSLALSAAYIFGAQQGDSILLAILVGSASYIAVPAVLRTAVPEANAGLYTALPLAVTFPINVILGLPYYLYLSKLLYLQ